MILIFSSSLLFAGKDHYVLKVVSERKIYLNYGKDDDCNNNDILIIQKSTEDIKDPVSGKMIKVNKAYEYKVRITFVDKNYSIGEIINKDDYGIAEIKDKVKEKIDMKKNLYQLDGMDFIQKTYRDINPNSPLSDKNLYFFISENSLMNRYYMNLFPSLFVLIKASMFRGGAGGMIYNSREKNNFGLFAYLALTPSFWITKKSTIDIILSLNGNILSNMDPFKMNYSYLATGLFNNMLEFKINNWYYDDWGSPSLFGGQANITLLYHYRNKKNSSYKIGYTFTGQKNFYYYSGAINYLHGIILEYSFRINRRHLLSIRNESYHYSFTDFSDYYYSYYDENGYYRYERPMRQYFLNKVNVDYYYKIDNFHMLSLSLYLYNYYDLNHSKYNIKEESSFIKNIAINVSAGFIISYF